MELEIYNIQKSGAHTKVRNVKSSYSTNRALIVHDPFNKKFWLIAGTSVDPEIVRMTSWAIGQIRKELGVKYKLEEVSRDDTVEKIKYFIEVGKNPELALSKPTKKAKIDKKIEKSKSSTAKSVSPSIVSPTSIPRVAISSKKKSEKTVLPKGDLEDEDGVEMIEDFQIAYYEKSSGFLLIEEFHESVEDENQKKTLTDHVKLINDMIRKGVKLDDARNSLNESVEILLDAFFKPKPKKKVAKKKPVKKKQVKKAAPKAKKKVVVAEAPKKKVAKKKPVKKKAVKKKPTKKKAVKKKAKKKKK